MKRINIMVDNHDKDPDQDLDHNDYYDDRDDW